MPALALLLAAALQAAPAPAPAAPAQPPRPVRDLASYVGAGDYPRRALRALGASTVYFELIVAPSGRVAQCRVTRSSGATDLDLLTCRIIVARARFRPARDAAGAPVEGRYASNMTWSIPGRRNRNRRRP